MIDTREKLKRYLTAYGISQAKADSITGAGNGKTFSYLNGRSDKILKPESNPDVMAYLEKLASIHGMTQDWFLDGRDDWPAGQFAPGADEAGVPIMGMLPMAQSDPEAVIGRINTVRPAVAPDARYYRLAEDYLPIARRGDDVMVYPTDVPRSGVLAVVESKLDGTRDIVKLSRKGSVWMADPITDGQEVPPEWTLNGIIIEIRRNLAGGLVVAYACETGITPDMTSL